MPGSTTRREALKTVAAGAALPVLGSAGAASLAQSATPYRPSTLSDGEFKLVTLLVDMIIPPSDTPGATAAGVDRYIDEELGSDQDSLHVFRKGLDMLTKAGFADLEEAEQVQLLTEYSEASGPQGEFFRLLKSMAVDGYYLTEIGLVQELGYKGNTFLKEFPGCQHEEHV